METNRYKLGNYYVEELSDGAAIIKTDDSGNDEWRLVVDNSKLLIKLLCHSKIKVYKKYFTICFKNQKTIPLHRWLKSRDLEFANKTNHDDEYKTLWVVDHIDGDPSNNRFNNLRVVSSRLNANNKAIMKNNSSGFAGISFNKKDSAWQVTIPFGGKVLYLKAWKDKADAVYARYFAETLVFGPSRSTRNDDKILEIIQSCNIKEDIEKYVKQRLDKRIAEAFADEE